MDALLHTLRARFDVKHTPDVTLYTIRHFKEDSANGLLKAHELVLEQRTQTTLQLVMK
jgi:aspartate kinase